MIVMSPAIVPAHGIEALFKKNEFGEIDKIPVQVWVFSEDNPVYGWVPSRGICEEDENFIGYRVIL